ncbi:adenylate/guanylate cyclase domain-containing protein [Pigmentiphaga soli]|uniref:Adenylate/guanylate cyclase domain-containing protein n=1 Tax=Pigmentiphaga soli TaxID=1007095 RepID=A0ABP8HFF4_9BURK
MASTLSLFLLGPLVVQTDGGAVAALRYNKARALLVYLALERGFHTRDSLAFLLWPEASVQVGRARLKRMLFELKDNLGAELLEGNRDVLRLRAGADVWTDVGVFTEAIESARRDRGVGASAGLDRVERAAALYRGQFLQGLELDDASEFSNWVHLRREQYLNAFLYAIRLLAEGHERDGALHEAIERAHQLTAAAPWDDSGWKYLLRLLVKAGQHERAQQEFEYYRQMLSAEMGAQPDESVRRILDAPCGGAPRPPSRMTERRQLTAVSCEFDAQGELEDVVEAVAGHVARCEAILQRACAHTVRTPSGGLLAYFGYPLAIENAARHAVAAAAECVEPADARPAPPGSAVGVCVGVHTGLVISSAIDGVADAGGAVSRVAVRLSSLAGRGQVFVSGATRQLLADAAELEFAGTLHGRQQSDQIDLFRLRRDRPALPARGARHPVAFCGRQVELGHLSGVWRDDAQPACLVIGEAGLGKSCLIEHFVARERIDGIVFKCWPELRQMPFHPFVHWIDRLRADQAAGALDRGLAPNLERLAGLLHAPRDQALGAVPPPAMRRCLLEELRALIDLCVPEGGVVVFDDAHWADPSTREMLAGLVDAPLPRRSVFVTARPDFVAPWQHGAPVQQLQLGPLDRADVVCLVRSVAGGQPLSDDVLQRIVALSEGVPLYAEELTRDVLSSASATADDGAEEPADVPLPRSLNDLLMSRIDSVGDVKPIAQFAAAAGGEFTLALLQAAMNRPRGDVAEAVAALLRHNLIVRLDEQRYMFRHALLREAAYQSQARDARLEAHRRLAEVMAQDPYTHRQSPESLAWHYLRAGNRRRALDYLLLAARNAAAKLAYREAAGYYRTALDVVAPAETPSAVMEELDIRMEFGIQLGALHGVGSPEAVEAFREALRLARPLGDDPRLFPVYWGLWTGASSWADFGMAAELSQTLLRLAEAAGDPVLRCHAHGARGQTALFLGYFAEAVEELERGVAAYRPGPGSLALGEDPLAAAQGMLGLAYWYVGRIGDAQATAAAAVERARHLDHAYSLAGALVKAAGVHRLCGHVDAVDGLAGEAGRLAQSLGTPQWEELAAAFRHWAAAARGDGGAPERIAASAHRMSGIVNGLAPLLMVLWTEASDLAGNAGNGLAAAGRGLAAADDIQDRHNLSEFQRLKGKFLAAQGFPEAIFRPWLETAVDSARQYASPTLLLRAVLSLAGHVQRPAAAHIELLRVCLGEVTGGDELWEVRGARELLGRDDAGPVELAQTH